MSLYLLFLFEYFRTHIPRVVFALLGISLGVGLFLSTTTNAGKAERSLIDFSLGYFRGDYKLKVGASQPGQTISWDTISYIYNDPRLRKITNILPRSQREAIASDNLRVLYLAIDLIKETPGKSLLEQDERTRTASPDNTTFVSQAVWDRYKGKPFDLLLDGTNREIRDYLPIKTEGGFLVFQDFSLASANIDTEKGPDYLLLRCSEDDTAYMKRILTEDLGGNFQVETSREIQEKSANALRSFQLNLLVISFISLLIAFFMVSNTMSGLYLSRERELGILRTLGLDHRKATFLFLSQSLILGILGSILGLGIGAFFSSLDFFRPESTLVDRSFLSTYGSIPAADYAIALLVGIAGSVFSALIPSSRAGKITPLSILRDASKGSSTFEGRKFAVAGIALFILSLGISNIPSPWKLPLPGLLGIGGIVIGITLTFPFCIKTITSMLILLLEKGDSTFPFLKIGLEELKENPGRNTLTAATVMLSVSLVLCLTILTDSYKRSLNDWVDSEFPSDITVINNRFFYSGIHGGVPRNLLAKIADLKITAYLDGFLVNTRFETDKGVFTVHAYDFDAYAARSDGPEKLVREETDILVSSNMAFLHKLKVGDSLISGTPTGPKKFVVRGIKEHFFSERGTVMMDIRSYEKIFGIRSLNSIKLFLKNEFKTKEGVATAKQELRRLFASDPTFSDLALLDSSQLRELYLYEVNKVFRVLDSLKITALFITLISLLSSLMHNLFDKQRLLGLLKYLGASRSQLAAIIRAEAIFLTGFGAIFGILASLVMAPIILYVINRNAFGWTLTFTFLPWMPMTIMIAAPILGWLASFYPLRILKRLNFKLSPE
ncbi:MacB-like periplasmic core domain protein [Leptospira inadai serovar Lyme str. 10]|uniref:MacB-like periplasmic core domain protein n=2 Tax=Leptospira inadai serovar Lyme TaxID=293084 RepID=V6HC61_9LEPT|nr:FtsX-like permease family protein [Leptospira inadai]EQA37386.1 MacB-like periplasmic core domain protein [Leptospira inadai serovar Lyme str. 10]PNV71911.1 ABC transporter permease [Leptospira inadai serovar Lyme]